MKKLVLLFLLSLNVMAQAPIVTPYIKVNYSNAEDLKQDLAQIVREENVSQIFDKIEDGKVEIALINDYNFTDPNSPDLAKLNDDIGRTHGMRMAVYKNIAPMMDKSDLYFVSISYESHLYTNITADVPRPIDFYELAYINERGFWQVDIYFKEENLLRMMIGKMKSGNALYYQAGLGFQEINSEDNNRGFILSGISQQAWLHEGLNNINGRTLREYNYLPSGNNQRSITLEGEIGYDHTLVEGRRYRSYTRSGINTRISGIPNASFVGAYIQFGHDYKPSDALPAVRIAGSYHHKRSKTDSYREAIIEANLAGENLAINVRYILPFDQDPSYLRLFTGPADIEPLVELEFEGKW